MTMEQQGIPQISGYERRKARTRQLILKTATQMISEKGAKGLTIRAIAAQAELSPVTVYNLFGSKNAVLGALYNEDLKHLVAYYESHASADEMARIFELTDLALKYYSRKLRFYRALLGALIQYPTSDVAAGYWSARAAGLRRQLSAAIAAGCLEADMPIDLIEMIFVWLGKTAMQEFVDGVLTANEACRRLLQAQHLILERFATRKGRRALTAIRKTYGMDARPAK